MKSTFQPFLTVAAIGAVFATSACQAGAPSGTGYVPNSSEALAGAAAPRRSKGYLYAVTWNWDAGSGAVYYYDAYGKNTSSLGSLQISDGLPDGVWTDAHGNVYVAIVNTPNNNGRGYINEYTPGFDQLRQTYTAGLDGPSGGTFDAAGNMYVANLCGTAPSISCSVFAKPKRGSSSGFSGYVSIYPAGKTSPSTYLTTPINAAVDVAVDKSNNVFVVNNTGGIAWNVIEFGAGSTQGKVVAFRHLPKQRWVGADTFAPNGSLVISVNNAVDLFPHERGRPADQLTDGIYAADGLAYGPDGTLFAGNYEFEQNEGDAVAFPPGSKSPARTYAVPYGNGVVEVAVGRASN
jgi:hypothetical protein